MRKYVWRSVAVILLMVCMNMKVQAAYFAYTETVKNQIQLSKVEQESVNAATFQLMRNDADDLIASESDAKMETASESNADERIETASKSNADKSTELASDSNTDEI